VILPDVNVLVYAFRREAERHDRYATWLAEVVAGGDELALNDHSLIGFARIVTNPRIRTAAAAILPERAGARGGDWGRGRSG